MKFFLLLIILPFVFVFSQIQSLEKSSYNCTIKNTEYLDLLNQPKVEFFDLKVVELNSILHNFSSRKRVVKVNDVSTVFVGFKLFSFPNQIASKYTYHENYFNLEEAKLFLTDLIKLEEEFNKNNLKKEITYYNQYINSKSTVRVGFEISLINQKTIAGVFKKDYNGDYLFDTSKIWFIDIDTSCNDNRTQFLIKDIKSFIEELRNTINS